MTPRDTVHARHVKLQREWELWRGEVWGAFLRTPMLKDLARTVVLTMLFASLVHNVAQSETGNTLSAKFDEIIEAARFNDGWVRLDFAD